MTIPVGRRSSIQLMANSILLYPSFEERKDLSFPATTPTFFLSSLASRRSKKSVCLSSHVLGEEKRRTTPNTYVARCIVSTKEILGAMRYGEPLV